MLAILQILAQRTDRREETGATATEYALLVGFIAIVIVAGVTLFGTALSGMYSGFATRIGTLN